MPSPGAVVALALAFVVVCAAEGDVCRRLCEGPLAAQYSKPECERGCRLFNIAMNTNPPPSKLLDLNNTKDQCQRSCCEAYSEAFRVHCFSGCAEMLNLQRETWLYFERHGTAGDGFLTVEVSFVSEMTLPDDYRMPQAYIRTMPLRPDIEDDIDSKNWTPCLARSNAIPRWLVAMIAVLLTIFTLYVSFILPSRTDPACIDDAEYERRRRETGDDSDDDLRKELNILYHKKDPADNLIFDLNLMTLNEFLVEDYHANIVPPPKYTPLPVSEVA